MNDQYQHIPEIHREYRLISCLIPVMLVGAEQELDQESKLFLRVLVRLVDKSFDEYMQARIYIIEEMQTGDKFAFRFTVINHLENALNALHRALGVFDIILNGKKEKGKRIKKQFNLLGSLDNVTRAHLERFQVSRFRHRVEHLDEDIFEQRVRAGMFLDVDESYQHICVQGKCIAISEFAKGIKESHDLVLRILRNLK